MTNPVGRPITDVRVKIIGEDGNAFAILGRVQKALRQVRYDKEFIGKYMEQATSGSYDNLLHATMTYVEVE